MSAKIRMIVPWHLAVSVLSLLLVACDEPDEMAQADSTGTPRLAASEQQHNPSPPKDAAMRLAQARGAEDAREPGEPAGRQIAPSSDSAEAAARSDPLPPVGTFTPRVEDRDDIWRNRLPSGDGRSILIPSVTLFPGAVRIDPGIENPYSGNAEAIAAGERHFAAYNCAGCHAPLGGGGMGPPLSDSEWIYGGEPAQIYLSIMHGRGDGMPAWAAMLPRKAAWELVAYIETLSEIEDPAGELGFEKGGRYKRPASQRESQQPGTGGEAEPGG